MLSSLSCGVEDALAMLLRSNALHGVLYALSDPQYPLLRAALARCLRILASAITDIVSPSQWGLRPERLPWSRQQAREAFDHLFHVCLFFL